MSIYKTVSKRFRPKRKKKTDGESGAVLREMKGYDVKASSLQTKNSWIWLDLKMPNI